MKVRHAFVKVGDRFGLLLGESMSSGYNLVSFHCGSYEPVKKQDCIETNQYGTVEHGDMDR